MTESPRPTDKELEQGPSRIDEEEEMRGPSPGDPEPPADEEDGDDS